MRHLITSLQGHNSQLKAESNRLKKRVKEYQHEIQKLKHELSAGHHRSDSVSASSTSAGQQQVPSTGGVGHGDKVDIMRQDSRQSTGSGSSDKELISPIKVEGVAVKLEPLAAIVKEEGDADNNNGNNNVKKMVDVVKDESASAEIGLKDKELKDLKLQHSQLKSKHESLKSMYESSQNKIKDLKKQLASISGPNSSNNNIPGGNQSSTVPTAASGSGSSSSGVPTDAQINKLKDKIRGLEKQISQLKSAHQQQEEALLNEMEMTGSAFENMQEMNLRLIQQLREKDDANFKLMSERIKSQQIQKLLKEEKESLTEQVIALQAQVNNIIIILIS